MGDQLKKRIIIVSFIFENVMVMLFYSIINNELN